MFYNIRIDFDAKRSDNRHLSQMSKSKLNLDSVILGGGGDKPGTNILDGSLPSQDYVPGGINSDTDAGFTGSYDLKSNAKNQKSSPFKRPSMDASKVVS